MEAPQRLYEQVLTIMAYGSTGDLERERKLTEEFLGTLRSREKVLGITGIATESRPREKGLAMSGTSNE
jgi:hypothetical protein